MATEKKTIFDFDAASRELVAIVEHFQKSAPTVSRWADGLYVRLQENAPIQLREVCLLDRFRDEDTREFIGAQDAANRVYHLMVSLGQDTTGHAGF